MKSFSKILSGHGAFKEKMLDVFDCTFRQAVGLGIIRRRGFVLNAFCGAKVGEIRMKLWAVVRADDGRDSEVAEPGFELVKDRGC